MFLQLQALLTFLNLIIFIYSLYLICLLTIHIHASNENSVILFSEYFEYISNDVLGSIAFGYGNGGDGNDILKKIGIKLKIYIFCFCS